VHVEERAVGIECQSSQSRGPLEGDRSWKVCIGGRHPMTLIKVSLQIAGPARH
jgi:hypothetical protein